MKKLLLTVGLCIGLGGCVGYVDPYGGYGNYPQETRGGRGDRDGDGISNRRDRDRDGDGVPNRRDDRPNNPRRY